MGSQLVRKEHGEESIKAASYRQSPIGWKSAIFPDVIPATANSAALDDGDPVVQIVCNTAEDGERYADVAAAFSEAVG